ncbi:MAG: alginate export family protein [Firmicutes bacterium]|nr:alginate export family protein [Bacillota bacterium]
MRQSKKFRKVLLIIAVLFFPLLSFNCGLLADEVKVTEEVRIRSEIRNNADFNSSLNDYQNFAGDRVRLNISEKWNDSAKFFASVQHARNTGTTPDFISLYQGYFEMGKVLKFKVGRQEYNLGDNRLVGNGNWTNSARSFDSVRMDYHHGNTDWMIFDAKLVKTFNQPAGSDQYLYGTYNRWQINKFNLLETYFLGKYVMFGGAGNRNLNIYTAGCRYVYDRKPWYLEIEPPIQWGDNGRLIHSAYAYSIVGSYEFKSPFKPRLQFERAFATGDPNPNDLSDNTFDNLYPTNHKRLGIIDYQSWKNLDYWKIGLELKPSKKLTVNADYNFFKLAEARDAWYRADGSIIMQDPTGRSGTDTGKELDLYGVYKINDNLTLSLGNATFYPGDYVKKLKGKADPSTWLYFQIEYKN